MCGNHPNKEDVGEGDVDEPTLKTLTGLAGVDMPRGKQFPRQKALDEALDWVQNNTPNPEDIGKSMLKPPSKLAGLLMPK